MINIKIGMPRTKHTDCSLSSLAVNRNQLSTIAQVFGTAGEESEEKLPDGILESSSQ